MSAQQPYDVVFYSPWIGPLIQPALGSRPGGAETQTLLVATALAARGHRVAIVADDPEGTMPHWHGRVRVLSQRVPSGSRWSRFPRRVAIAFWVLARTRTRNYVQRGAATITPLVAVAARLTRRRFIFSSANVTDFEWSRLERSRLKLALYKVGIRLAREIVVQTTEQVVLCESRFGRTPTLIPSAAEETDLATASPEAFLWAGRLEHHKNPMAYVDLAARLPDARFRMVGLVAGTDGPALRDAIARRVAGLSNFELLEGVDREELGRFMDRAVAVVNTSRDYEGMPNVFLEGWMRGVPALSLDQDPDGVIEGERIGAVAGGSDERFAALAHELWEHRDARAELSLRCRNSVLARHDLERVVEQWERLLAAR